MTNLQSDLCKNGSGRGKGQIRHEEKEGVYNHSQHNVAGPTPLRSTLVLRPCTTTNRPDHIHRNGSSEKYKKTTHKPQIVRPTPITPITPSFGMNLAGGTKRRHSALPAAAMAKKAADMPAEGILNWVQQCKFGGHAQHTAAPYAFVDGTGAFPHSDLLWACTRLPQCKEPAFGDPAATSPPIPRAPLPSPWLVAPAGGHRDLLAACGALYHSNPAVPLGPASRQNQLIKISQ